MRCFCLHVNDITNLYTSQLVLYIVKSNLMGWFSFITFSLNYTILHQTVQDGYLLTVQGAIDKEAAKV